MHLSFSSPCVGPRGMVQYWYFFFPHGGGKSFSFGNEFAGPRRYTHGICSRQWDSRGENCFIWFDCRCVKLSKKRANKLDTFVCYFCHEKKRLYFGLTIKGWRRLCYSWQLVEDIMLWVFVLPLGKGCLSLMLCPLPTGFEWLLFVTKNNSRGSTHGGANDKCITV